MLPTFQNIDSFVKKNQIRTMALCLTDIKQCIVMLCFVFDLTGKGRRNSSFHIDALFIGILSCRNAHEQFEFPAMNFVNNQSDCFNLLHNDVE